MTHVQQIYDAVEDSFSESKIIWQLVRLEEMAMYASLHVHSSWPAI
jgi:hypothetical protein